MRFGWVMFVSLWVTNSGGFGVGGVGLWVWAVFRRGCGFGWGCRFGPLKWIWVVDGGNGGWLEVVGVGGRLALVGRGGGVSLYQL